MKKHFLRCSFLLLLLVPMTMNADIAFLNATLTPINGGEVDGFAFGTVNINGLTLSVNLSYGGLSASLAGAGIFGPVPNTDLNDQLGQPNEIFGLIPNFLQPFQGSISGIGSVGDQSVIDGLEGGQYFFNLYVSDPTLALRGQIVPEPSAWTMLAVCIGFVVWKMRRRRIA